MNNRISTSATVIALVPAAGSGTRMKHDIPKQYRLLHKIPMLSRTLRALSALEWLTHIAVILSPDDQYWQNSGAATIDKRIRSYRVGGNTRMATVYSGLNALRQSFSEDSWVLVHDAARPFISYDAATRLYEAVRHGNIGGILALPITDTVKRVSANQRILHSEDRDTLWCAQTPQMFRLRQLIQALSGCVNLSAITDEASAIELAGGQPQIVMGDSMNFKLTVEDDWYKAEQFCTFQD